VATLGAVGDCSQGKIEKQKPERRPETGKRIPESAVRTSVTLSNPQFTPETEKHPKTGEDLPDISFPFPLSVKAIKMGRRWRR
jgi:hypothetical protein